MIVRTEYMPSPQPVTRRVYDGYVLRHREQIVPVHTLVLANLVVGTDATCVDHDPALRVRLRIEEVVALGAEVKGGLESDAAIPSRDE